MTWPITTIFFDWDYTLAYTKTPTNTIGERLARMFALAGLPYSQAAIERAIAQYERAVLSGQLPRIEKPQRRRDIARFYGYLFDFLGEADKSWSTMERLYGTYAQLPTFLFEDSRPILQELREQGYTTGIISNHSSSARPVMEDLVGDLIPTRHMVISEELGIHKPARTIYRRAAGRVRQRPANCILVGDNLEADALGAIHSGGFGGGIWLDRNNSQVDGLEFNGVKRITALNQLPAILASFNSSHQAAS